MMPPTMAPMFDLEPLLLGSGVLDELAAELVVVDVCELLVLLLVLLAAELVIVPVALLDRAVEMVRREETPVLVKV